MGEIVDDYFHNIPGLLKTYWLENIPFIDEREKHILILLFIGNNSLCIAKRLGLKLDDVLFDRDNLFKKIQLFEGVDTVGNTCDFVENIEKIKEKIEKVKEKNEMKYCVYSLTFPDGKMYIGLTCDATRRWSNGHGYRQNGPMHEAIAECGWDKVEKQILYSELSYGDAREKEKSLILEHKTLELEYGYNRTL